MRIQDKVAIVTGAAGGIGEQIVRLFAKEGGKVVATDINADKLSEIVASINAEGGSAIAVPADVSNDADVAAVVAKAVSEFGRLDIMVNNAGMMDKLVPLHELDTAHWRKISSINLDGPIFFCREAVKQFLAQQSKGSVVNVSSIAGIAGGRGGLAYTASKHGVVGLTRAMAWYYHSKGIRTNCICPGNIATLMGTGGKPNKEGMDKYMPYFATMPQPYGDPAKVAQTVLHLASDESEFVNGAVFPVDGSWTAF